MSQIDRLVRAAALFILLFWAMLEVPASGDVPALVLVRILVTLAMVEVGLAFGHFVADRNRK